MTTDLLVYLLQGLPSITLRHPEERLSFEVRTALVELSASGQLKATWAGIPNEIANRKNPAFGRKLKAQGKLAGCPDYVILAPPGLTSFWLELKAEKGRLTPSQKMFQGWAASVGCPHHVARSLEEVIGLLREYHLIAGST